MMVAKLRENATEYGKIYIKRIKSEKMNKGKRKSRAGLMR